MAKAKRSLTRKPRKSKADALIAAAIAAIQAIANEINSPGALTDPQKRAMAGAP